MRVHLHASAVGEPLLCELRAAAPAVAGAPNFWIPRAAIEAAAAAPAAAAGAAPDAASTGSGAAGASSSSSGAGSAAAASGAATAVDAAVAQLYARCMQRRLPPDWAGAEYWVQVYQPGRGLAFHFDKDEHRLVEEGVMAHPTWSSVLYLTGSDATGAVREAPTVIIDQVFDQAAGAPVPEDPTASCLVYPLAGSYCVFDGALGHGVLDSFATSTRMTLLVNWWRHQPQAVHVATPQQLRQLGIPLLGQGPGSSSAGASSSQADAAAGALAGLAVAEGGSGAADVSSGGGGAAGGSEVPTAASAAAAPASSTGSQAEAPLVPIAEVSAPAAEGLDHAVLIDDLVAAAGLKLTGPGAVSGVRVAHPGLVLLPLDPGDVQQQEAATAAAAGGGEQQAAGGRGRRLQTAAALVPPCMLPSEGESGESSSGGEEA